MVPTMECIFAAWPESLPPHQWGCTATIGIEIGVKASLPCAKTITAVGFDVLTDAVFVKKAKDEFDH
jgi:aminobenzoyl-glutamate utilization protein B